MSDKVHNILFICTGNSARSIMAEGLMNHLGGGRFKAWSAGSHPNGTVNPFALKTLAAWHAATDGYRSKDWDEFAKPDAPTLDFVFTVCDNAAGEVCPYWPGQPATAHWGYADPSETQGSEEEKLAAFAQTLHQIKHRLDIFTSLPNASLERMSLQQSARALAQP